MDYRQEMKELRDTLNAHGYRYYVLDEPTISDYEYDHMLRRLEDLEAAHPEEITPDSPTQRIGGRTLSEFQQVTHPVPLESLQDVFNDDEVCQFLERYPWTRRCGAWSQRWTACPWPWSTETACSSAAPHAAMDGWGRT